MAVTALLVPRAALAQGAGSVEGTVVDDAGGAPLAGAAVTLEETGASATTGPDGTFTIENVSPGVYTLSAILDGFAPLVATVTVTAGAPSLLDLRLPSAEFEESVVVAGVFSELDLRNETAIGSRLPLQAMDVPASIGIIDSTAIARRGYLRVSDVMEGMANVIVGQFPAEPSSFSIRGFSQGQITVLRDNIWLGPANMTMRRQNTFNLDRVELLRGPSSVINGQGAVAGTVNMVTKQAQPTTTTDFSSMLSYGQFNTYQAAVGVNGPAGDTVFYRFDVSRFGSNGHVERMDPFSSNVTGSLLWRPSDRGQLRLNIDYLNDDSGSYFGTPLLPRDVPGVQPLGIISTPTGEVIDGRTRFINYNVDDATAGAETFLFRVDGEVALGDNARFTNTLYNFTATRNWQNAEGFPYCNQSFEYECPRIGEISRYNGYFYVDHDQDLIGNRAQIEVATPLGGGRKNDLVIGVEATKLDFERDRGYRPDPWELGFDIVQRGDYVDLLNPTPGSYGPRDRVGVAPTFLRSWAVFLEDSLPVNDRLRLSGAVRFDGMSLDRQNLDRPGGTLDQDSSFTRDFTWASWRAGAVIGLVDDVVAYGQISNAKDPVGENLFLVNAGQNYDLTDARQFEFGLKADVVGGRTQMTAAVFDIERDDILEQYDLDSVFNVGGIRSRGFELALSSRPNDDTYFGASFAITNAELVSGANNMANAGNTPGNVPGHVAEVWASYENIGGSPLELGASVRSVGDRYATHRNAITMNAYTVSDVWLALNLPQARLSLNVYNLADTAYASWAHYQYIGNVLGGPWDWFYANQLMLGPPRTVSLTLTTGF